MREDQKNLFMAMGLSLLVIIGWNYFYGVPEAQRARNEQTTQQQVTTPWRAFDRPTGDQTQAGAPPAPASPAPTAPSVAIPPPPRPRLCQGQPGPDPRAGAAAAPRVESTRLQLVGSINLRGGRIDDRAAEQFRETIQPGSTRIPGDADLGQRPGPDLPPHDLGGRPVHVHHRNASRTSPISRSPCFPMRSRRASASRRRKASSSCTRASSASSAIRACRNTATTARREGAESRRVSRARAAGSASPTSTGRRHHPGAERPFEGALHRQRDPPRPHLPVRLPRARPHVAPGADAEATHRIFAGRQGSRCHRRYHDQYNIKKFDLLIDWGWFYFITKPLFYALDFFYKLVGNFGVAILIVTVLIKMSSSRSPTSPTPRWRR
jgi:YidC/Oxa1 family membrane protein insertase